MGKDLKGKNIGKGFSQRKDGRYEARCMIEGEKLCLYGFDLQQLKKDFEKAKLKLKCYTTNDYSNMLLKDWFEEWFVSYKLPRLKNKECAKVYKRKVKNTYIEELGFKKLSYISQLDVQNATNTLIKSYTYRMIREALSSFSQCMEVAMCNKGCTVNPCQEIYIDKCNISPPKDIRYLEEWEIELFSKVLENHYYREPFLIMMCTGMRIGEFAALCWEDVDFQNKCINIKHSLTTHYIDGKKLEKVITPKTINGFRKIPFFDGVEDLFISWQKKQATYKNNPSWQPVTEFGNLVFTTTKGTPVNRYVAQHTLTKLTKEMRLCEMTKAFDENRMYREIKNIHPHALRHTFATLCFKQHLDPVFIQRIMGHADYATTLHYTHILKQTSEEEVRKFKNPVINMAFNKLA